MKVRSASTNATKVNSPGGWCGKSPVQTIFGYWKSVEVGQVLFVAFHNICSIAFGLLVSLPLTGHAQLPAE